MSKEISKKEAIEKHFYSTNMTRADFERENWDNYGYQDLANFHRQMSRWGISVKKRSEHWKQTRPHSIRPSAIP
jgi:hypothetical protein